MFRSVIALVFLIGCAQQSIQLGDGGVVSSGDVVQVECFAIDYDQDNQAEEWGGFIDDVLLEAGQLECTYQYTTEWGDTELSSECVVEPVDDVTSWVGVAHGFDDRVLSCSIQLTID